MALAGDRVGERPARGTGSFGGVFLGCIRRGRAGIIVGAGRAADEAGEGPADGTLAVPFAGEDLEADVAAAGRALFLVPLFSAVPAGTSAAGVGAGGVPQRPVGGIVEVQPAQPALRRAPRANLRIPPGVVAVAGSHGVIVTDTVPVQQNDPIAPTKLIWKGEQVKFAVTAVWMQPL
jgi:hypothetical protein